MAGADADNRARAAALLRAALGCAEEAAARHLPALVPALCRVRALPGRGPPRGYACCRRGCPRMNFLSSCYSALTDSQWETYF